MKAVPAAIDHFDFSFPNLDTLVRVEINDGEVTIRATRDTFSVRRKELFIQELAAEGFIPDAYGWSSTFGTQPDWLGLRWIVDFSWLEIGPEARARSNRLIFKLFSGSTLILVLLFGLLFTGHLGNVRVKSDSGAASAPKGLSVQGK